MNSWRFKEIVVMAALVVVFGVVYLAFLSLGSLLVGFTGPIGYDFIFGIWFIVSIIAEYILQISSSLRGLSIIYPNGVQ